MLIGYARVSKADSSQSLDLQRDALRAEGIDDPANLYHDFASGVRDDRPGLDNCLRALRKGDILVVWKLDRLGRNLAHLVHTVQDLSARGVGPAAPRGSRARTHGTTISQPTWPGVPDRLHPAHGAGAGPATFQGSAQNRANLYAKPFASHETAVELVLAVEEDVVPPDRADMGQ